MIPGGVGFMILSQVLSRLRVTEFVRCAQQPAVFDPALTRPNRKHQPLMNNELGANIGAIEGRAASRCPGSAERGVFSKQQASSPTPYSKDEGRC